MKLRVAWVGKTRSAAIRSLSDEYLTRLRRYVAVEGVEAASEAALLRQTEKASGRTAPLLVLLDGGGRQMSSEELAAFLEQQESSGTQVVVFAVGGADGWSEAARSAARVTLSLGKMTLAHEVARVVLLEQLYRAYTILKGHPYHTGH